MTYDFKVLFPMKKFDPSMVATKRQWLIEGIWQLNRVNAIAAPVKSGKSRLLCWLLVGLFGGRVFGLPAGEARPTKILYLAAEEGLEEDLHERLMQYARLQGVNPSLIDITVMTAMGLGLEMTKRQKELESVIVEGDFTVLVIDPMIRIHQADESDNSQMTKVLTTLRGYVKRLGITLIFLHHVPKPNEDTDLTKMEHWFRGAGDFAAVVDAALYCSRFRNSKDKQYHINVLRGGRFAPLPPLDVVDLGDEGGFQLCK